MAQATSIEWAQHSWNPIRGCSRVSAGCDNCYAMHHAHRFSGEGLPFAGLTVVRNGKVDWSSKIMLVEKDLLAPLRRREPTRYFVNSMSDVFHHGVPDEYIDKMFAVMALCPQHTFLILTKRPERMQKYLMGDEMPVGIYDAGVTIIEQSTERHLKSFIDDPDEQNAWPLKNVWLGVSVEDQKTADERIPILLKTPAAIRWISAEPLLGQIDLKGCLDPPAGADPNKQKFPADFDKWDEQRKSAWIKGAARATYIAQCEKQLDWIVVGGESGPKARTLNIKWVSDLIEQCQKRSVAVFVKQLGSRPVATITKPLDLAPLKLSDRKGGNMDEWPSDLRVREYPKAEMSV